MMIELGVIRDLVAVFGVIAGLSYYVMTVRINLKNQELMLKSQQQTLETRRLGIIQNISSQITSEEGLKRYYELMNFEWSDYDDFERKYGSDFNTEAAAKRFAAWGIFNTVGLMLRRGLVEAGDLLDLGLQSGVSLWWKYKPIILENRRRYNGSTYLKDFEYLVEELLKVMKERDPDFDKPKTGPKYISTN